MYQSGQIYYTKKFKQGETSQEKNRYCVILTIREVDYAIIIHKVTSQSYCDPSLLKPQGNTVNEDQEIFYFPAKEIVGKNGFFFNKNSYIHMGVWNISEFTLDKFQSFEMEFKDDMLDDWLNSLIYFVYKSDHIKQKYQEILESELERLNPE